MPEEGERTMRRMMLLTFGLCVVLSTAAVEARQATAEPSKAQGEPGDPKDILKKSAAALQKVKLVRYKAEYQGTAWVTAHVPNIQGTVILGEPSKHDINRFRSDVKLTPQGSSDTIELSAGSDGDVFFLIDPKTKTVYADMDEAVLGTHQRNVRRVLLGDFVAKEPLADDLKAEKVGLEEPTDVGGEACCKVRVTRSETQAVVWYISKGDWLPRRVDRLYKNPQGEEGSTQLVLTDLMAEPACDTALFKVTVPPGFTKTDEFAP